MTNKKTQKMVAQEILANAEVQKNSEWVEFLENFIDKLDKKSGKSNKKNDEAKAEADALVLEILEDNAVSGLTASAILKLDDRLEDYSTQKLVPVLKRLADSGLVYNVKDKKQSLWYLSEYETDEITEVEETDDEIAEETTEVEE